MGGNYARTLYKDYERLVDKHELLKKEFDALKYKYKLQEQTIARMQANEASLAAKEKEQEAQIEALKKEVARLTALRETDSTNSGLSTAKTPLHKKKHIPNSRAKTDKHKGGQPGHPQKKLEPFKDEEVTEDEVHMESVCPKCGGKLEQMDDETTRDELDYEVTVRKIRHHFPNCRCTTCGAVVRTPISSTLSAENQYGARTKSLILALANDGNMSMNKISRTISGLTGGEICPSEGYIAKQQRFAAARLSAFHDELAKAVRNLSLLYWDDTVIMINKRRGCLRFYGNDRLALYCAHEKKNKEGLDEDNILSLLSASTIVMHDHNTVNYNDDYSFTNIECNVHLLRDLQKATDNLGHAWSGELKELLERTNQERNDAIRRGEKCFGGEQEQEFYEAFDGLLLKGLTESESEKVDRYYVREEKALLRRLLKYKDNYLAWVSNWDLPFSNNLSERGLRGVKSKQKVAGQFQNVETANCYAQIRSYIETCHRNGINVVDALECLCRGTPLSLTHTTIQIKIDKTLKYDILMIGDENEI